MSNRLFFLFSFLFALMIITLLNQPAYTGYATFATPEETLAVVNVLAADNSLQLMGERAQLCLVVEIDNATTYYYRLVKTGGIVDVNENYCADPGQDNIIIKFNSYDDLLAARSNPVTFIQERRNTGYYIFPSNYVEQGGVLKCTQSFQQNYCAPFYYYSTSTDLAQLDLACCANYELSPEQLAKVEQLKTGKPPSGMQSPLTFLFSTTGIMIAIIFIVVIVIVSTLIATRPKNPLIDYVKTTKAQGYSDENIKNALAQSGWDEKTINDALKSK